MRDPRYDILFEPVQIGPVKTRNRFYQVPHCTGLGHRFPQADAYTRKVKAQGGWGVISTQEAEIHPTADITPANEARLWDKRDYPALRLMTDSVHDHGSLAAIELVHGGMHISNRYSRELPIGPSHGPVSNDDPVQARMMDKTDIREFRQWHKNAALRAKDCGFDIIYVYAGHGMTLLQQFLLTRFNQRNDEYGGCFENRLRLFKEVIADTKDAVGDTCAIAIRLAVDELLGREGLQHNAEGRDIIEALAEEPDLWDVNISGWNNDSQTSRFSEEGFQEPYITFVKSLTTKPVVGVGRYTSPDAMVRVIKQGKMDLIGAARPSIADPFLPQKIETGRLEEIRECIGCNICVSSDNLCSPIRCTQNPTMGEEWRRNWHPEYIPELKTQDSYLIIGGGPAGLEAGLSLAKRGADVTLADKAQEWGGRVVRESRLPGLSAWARVRDGRLWQLQQKPNVEMYLESALSAEDILRYGISHIAIATGSYWRNDAAGRHHRLPLNFLNTTPIISPDAIIDQDCDAVLPEGPIVIFDDDRYYMASVLAEKIASSGRRVTYVTPSPMVAAWSDHTLEQGRIQKSLMELDVEIITSHGLADYENGRLDLACDYTGRIKYIECACLIPVTSRLPQDDLFNALKAREKDWKEAGIKTITRIGDCLAPGVIAAACYSGHKYAREAGCDQRPEMKREDYITFPKHD